MSTLATKELCQCGAPVFAGDDDVCDTCARIHREELLEAAKIMVEFYDELIAAPEFSAEQVAFVNPLREAIQRAEGAS